MSSASIRDIGTVLPETENPPITSSLSFADEATAVAAADPVCSFDEIGPVLEKAHVLSTLSIPEIMRSARLLRAARIFSATLQPLPDEGLEKFKSFNTGEILPCPPDLNNMIKKVAKGIDDLEFGEIRPMLNWFEKQS